MNALLVLAGVAVVADDLDAASEWLSQVEVPEPSRRDATIDVDVACMLARIAMRRGDLPAALALYPPIDRFAQNSYYFRGRLYCHGIAGRIELMDRGQLSVTRLQTLLEGHMQGRGTGSQDFAMGTLALGLSASGRRDAAQALVVDYLRLHRRERSDLPIDLLEVARGLQVDVGGITRQEGDYYAGSLGPGPHRRGNCVNEVSPP